MCFEYPIDFESRKTTPIRHTAPMTSDVPLLPLYSIKTAASLKNQVLLDERRSTDWKKQKRLPHFHTLFSEAIDRTGRARFLCANLFVRESFLTFRT